MKINKFNTLVLHEVIFGQPKKFEDISNELFSHTLNLAKNFLSIDEVYELGNRHKELSICLTFDDGFLSDYEIVLPALKERDFKATFFIVHDFIGKPGYMQKEHIVELSNAGMQIGSHSKTHPNFLKIDKKTKEYELSFSKSFLEDLTGKNVTTFSFPFGFEDRESIEAVFASGYKYCCTSRHGISNNHSNVISRNSINSKTKISQIHKNIRPTGATRLYWSVEDFLKSNIKHHTPNLYPKIRDFVSKF